MNKTPEVQKTIALVFVELFFATLPIILLGFAAAASKRPDEFGKFWSGPEWPMTSAILYGLTISRYFQGLLRVIQSGQLTELFSERILLLILAPTGGLALSGIFLMAALDGPPLWLQILDYINVFIAICLFIVLGGYGIKNAD